jgi:hypothetical protein
MKFIPIANVAQKNVNRMTEPREEIAAIMGSVPAMEEEIGVRSGAAPGAGIFKTNLYTGEASAAADKAYGEALTRALPQYVNAYRAYLEEQKKKKTGDGTTSPYTFNYTMPPTLPPVSAYVPNVGGVKWVEQNRVYGVSPYGAMPMGTIPKPGPQPASRVLAQRRVTSTRGKAGME